MLLNIFRNYKQQKLATTVCGASDYFDQDYYLRTYPESAKLGPLRHYIRNPHNNPSLQFNTAEYLLANADVIADKVNPLYHYLTFGILEGRTPANFLGAIKVHLDDSGTGTVTNAEFVRVRGWVTSLVFDPLVTFYAYWKGEQERYFPISLDILRPDVAAAFPGSSALAGFDVNVPLPLVAELASEAKSKLVLFAATENGRQKELVRAISFLKPSNNKKTKAYRLNTIELGGA